MGRCSQLHGGGDETGLADGSGEGGETKDKHQLGLELG